MSSTSTSAAAIQTAAAMPTHSPSAIRFFEPPSAERLAELAKGEPLTLNAMLRAARAYLDSVRTMTDASAQKNVQQPNTPNVGPRVHVAFGNEACDMDSMVCSLVLCWYLASLHPPSTGNIFIPMMNQARDELKLRGEAAFSFQQAGVDPDLLLFREDVDLASLQAKTDLGVFLVDHNSLEGLQSFLAPNVVGIIDHHKDEELYPRTQGNRIIETQGSCTSLLGDMILRNAPSLLSPTNFEREIDYEHNRPPTPLGVVTLLWHTLLLDTSDMSVVTGKAKEKDILVYAAYSKLLSQLTHAELGRRRADVSKLTSAQLLLKDTKYGESKRYPHFVTSIPCGLQVWAQRDPQLLLAIEQFTRDKSLRFCIVLTTDHTHGFSRQITVCVNQDLVPPPVGTVSAEQLFAALKAALEQDGQSTLDVAADESLLPAEARAVPHRMLVQTYVQRNLKGSRKQVAPLMEMITSKL